MKWNKKKGIIALSAVLVTALTAGGITWAFRNSGGAVKVAPVSNMNSGGYWSESGISSYGYVTNGMNQEIYYDNSIQIKDIKVSAGDTVKIGDVLIEYDAELLTLQAELKQMQINSLDTGIQIAEKELEELNKKKKKTAAADPAPGQHAAVNASPASVRVLAEPEEMGQEGEQGGEQGEPLPLLTGNVYTQLDVDSVPHNQDTADGSEENPYRYYVKPAEGTSYIPISKAFLKTAIESGWIVILDTVNSREEPTGVTASTRMDFALIAQILQETIDQKVAEKEQELEEKYKESTPAETKPEETTPEETKPEETKPEETTPEETKPEETEPEETEPEETEPEDPGEDPFDDPGWIDYPVDPGEDPGEDPYALPIDVQISSKEIELKDLDLQKKHAQSEYDKLTKELGDGTIKATVNGTISTFNGEEEAKLSGVPIMVVSGEAGSYVTGYVSETYLDKIETGMTLSCMSWEDGMTYEATISSIGTTPTQGYSGENSNMSWYTFVAVIEGETSFYDGSGVEITMNDASLSSGGYHEGIFLSDAFVREEGNRYYVYVKGEDGRLTKRYVETGRIVWGNIEIKSGLSLEDEIAFPYGKNVKEGAKTEPADTLYEGEYYYY